MPARSVADAETGKKCNGCFCNGGRHCGDCTKDKKMYEEEMAETQSDINGQARQRIGQEVRKRDRAYSEGGPVGESRQQEKAK